MMKYQVEVMKGNKKIDKETMLLNEESSQTEVSRVDLGEDDEGYDEEEMEDEGEDKGEGEDEYYDEEADYYQYYEE